MTGSLRTGVGGLLDVGRAVVLAIGALVGAVVLGIGAVLVPVGGLGVPLLVTAAAPLRELASVQRRWVSRRLATDVPEPPWPDREAVRPSTWRAFRLQAGYATTWRHVAWLGWQVLAGFLLPLLLVLPVYVGVVLLRDGGHTPTNTAARAMLAVVLFALPLLIAPAATGVHATVSRRLLAAPGNRSRLDRRADELAHSRSVTLRAQENLVRRIERDLHDGTQAHVVATGMTIGLARSVLHDSPERADALLAEAAQTVTRTLDELRALVHGIRPPVLAERGLGEAARAVAARCPVPVDTRVELPGAFPAEVETGMYFAVAETLTNIARHSGASHATLTLGHARGRLAARVTDDGHGGADAGAGSGLQGLRDRLGAFDGVVEIDSPLGGPTEIRMEVPCEPLSPKISLSSATG